MARGMAVEIVLTDSEREELGQRVRRRKIGRADAMRAEIVLLAADGLNNCAIAEELGISRLTVGTWRRRFAGKRLDGLDDEPRPGTPRKIGDDKIAEVTKTLETMPAHSTHWSTLKAGTVIGKCMRRHRAQEFRKFLDCIERNVPAELDIHIVMDNASSHKTRPIRNLHRRREDRDQGGGDCAL